MLTSVSVYLFSFLLFRVTLVVSVGMSTQSQKIAFFLLLRVKIMFKSIAKKFAVGSAFALSGILPAMAAVDPAVTTALSDAKADGATIGGAVLVVIVAIAAFKYIRRAL